MKKYLIIIIVALFQFSCTKEPNNINDDVIVESIQTNVENKIQSTPTYKGIYYDNFMYEVGDTAKENKFLRYCKKYNLTTISLYDLESILWDTKNYSKTSRFIRKARVYYGIKRVTAVIGDSSSAINMIGKYHSNYKDTLKCFNAINLELEWWNNACSWSVYKLQLSSIQKWTKNQKTKIGCETYIGWYSNPSGIDSLMADFLDKKCDRILVHDYEAQPGFFYTKDRIDWIGRCSKYLNKVQEVIVIFSAEPNFSGPYFHNNLFLAGYSSYVTGYKSTSFKGKNYMNITGYQIFDYGYAKSVRP